MDGICGAILNKIYALGGPGRYFIISEDEFFEAFPEDAERGEDGLRRALGELSKQGYVDVKYSSGNMYCVALLKTYEPPLPAYQTAEPAETPQSTPAPRTSALFWAGFSGAALGGTLTALISLLFLLC